MMRTEKDMLGSMELPEDCPWGIHTERSRRSFAVSGRSVPESLLTALADVKRACC